MQEFAINHPSLASSDEEESEDIDELVNSKKNITNAAKVGIDKRSYAKLIN